ncbi:hypothetical protein DMH04_15695 [Kibdelosporangium aridum]|uniref:Uncharacterized protein n=1 Tax=Kibdelosporangium aridum TaxID=2030 RepID=A0A428ZCA8_KIBAR|nr:hypothetical protein DMH04_15695 [Kibdelosporangium aridum]
MVRDLGLPGEFGGLVGDETSTSTSSRNDVQTGKFGWMNEHFESFTGLSWHAAAAAGDRVRSAQVELFIFDVPQCSATVYKPKVSRNRQLTARFRRQ